MKFKFFWEFFWKIFLKLHEIFGKNISPQDAYILKITTNLVGKNWPKFSQQKGLVLEVLCNGHKKCWYFFIH